VPLEPSTWFTLDERALPGVWLGHVGAVLVRWTAERPCIEAIDITAGRAEERGPRDPGHLVARFLGGKRRGGVLRTGGTRQSLTCRLEPNPQGDPG